MTKARDLANASTALSAVDATELGYLDGVTSAVQTQLDAKLASSTAATTYVANALADAKGDILVASADNTVTRLPVGSTGDTIVADGSTSTGLRYTSLFGANKNKIINGDFRINQRNFTSNTSGGDVYEFDRWLSQSPSSGTVTRTAQVFTTGAAPVAGYEGTNFYRYDVTGQSGSTARAQAAQIIESVRTFAGQTITISFWAKAASGTPAVAVALQQSFGTGGSPSSVVTTAAGKKTIGTSWARYSYTVAVPSISGKTLGTNNNDSLVVQIWFSGGSNYDSRTTTLGVQNNTFDIWGVQAEAGSVSTPFQTATGTLQGELAACMRYYIKYTSQIAWSGADTANRYGYIMLPYQMRTAPTCAFTYTTLYGTTNAPTIGSIKDNMARLSIVSSAATNEMYYDSAGYLTLSAEL